MMQYIYRIIHGFLTRQETEDCLNKSQNGTFLIRFSDSEPGGVSVAWITGMAAHYLFSLQLLYKMKYIFYISNDYIVFPN